MTDDPYGLRRFLDAQAPIYNRVCAELAAGEKRSHWMWFVFPQVKGLGYSYTAQKFAIATREEAIAYLAHPVLGARLQECTRQVLALEGRSAHEIFHSPDDLKFRSSMTLFAAVSRDKELFEQALQKYFDDEPDPRTLEILGKMR